MKNSISASLRGIMAIFLIAAGAYTLQAQESVHKVKDHSTNPDLFFLYEGDAPNSLFILPGPPDGGSVEFLNDQARYNWGKTLRNTPRGAQASRDAHVGGDGVPQAFSEAFGVEITKDGTPEIYKLVIGMREDCKMLALAQAEHFLFLFEFELERLLGKSFAGPVAAGLDFKRQGCLSRTYRGCTFGFHPFASVEVELLRINDGSVGRKLECLLGSACADSHQNCDYQCYGGFHGFSFKYRWKNA